MPPTIIIYLPSLEIPILRLISKILSIVVVLLATNVTPKSLETYNLSSSSEQWTNTYWPLLDDFIKSILSKEIVKLVKFVYWVSVIDVAGAGETANEPATSISSYVLKVSILFTDCINTFWFNDTSPITSNPVLNLPFPDTVKSLFIFKLCLNLLVPLSAALPTNSSWPIVISPVVSCDAPSNPEIADWGIRPVLGFPFSSSGMNWIILQCIELLVPEISVTSKNTWSLFNIIWLFVVDCAPLPITITLSAPAEEAVEPLPINMLSCPPSIAAPAPFPNPIFPFPVVTADNEL